MTAHPDLDDERRYLKRAYDLLDAMRQRTERVRNAGELAGTAVDSAIAQAHLSYRLSSLADSTLPLCFGRLDEQGPSGPQSGGQSHATWYIGRRHVEDATGDPVVVDWRAQVSTPFYRATFADPMGLARRRRFTLDGLDLVDLMDENFDDPDSVGGGGGVPDPLLAELERARTGEMRDIVATIQAEQDVVIRAPLDDLIIVQGGPGTGKTAVGLHRAAFLLYEHRLQLDDQRVLVVGPNRVFLRYISQVLPSLGETAVVQTTIDGLVGIRYPVRGEDGADVARVKGDARMAEVVRRACHGGLSLAETDIDASTPWGRVRIGADEINELLMATLDRDVPLNVGREGFRRQVERLAVQRGPALHDEFLSALRRDRSFRTTLDKAWPSMSAPAIVRRLLGNARVLAEAAGGLLSTEEQRLLLRKPAKRIDD
ncbi:MAG: HelD family protein, partial [Actinomycetota bacterium]